MPIAQEMILAQKFLSESLIQYEPQLIDTVYPEYWAYEGKYHNATAGLAFGAEGIMAARLPQFHLPTSASRWTSTKT
jgi:hypothetical protein